ncbi:MAG: hypothetical protein QM751_14815 [Paludibacteraceae bacterium]
MAVNKIDDAMQTATPARFNDNVIFFGLKKQLKPPKITYKPSKKML